MTDAGRRVLLHSQLIQGVGPATIGRLCRIVAEDELEQLYQWQIADFVARAGFSPQLAERLHAGLADHKLLSDELQHIDRLGISWCTISDPEYPELLREIHVPPTILFWKGATPANMVPAIAMVGSRAAGSYARRVAQELIPGLIDAGCILISGGAIGADTMVHETTLASGGTTAAIIGSGLGRPYPATNKKLFERIIASGGAVISTFPTMSEALPGNFPARNRIIAGMSRATVVLQAAEKSGARITALHALEQGREVCAVPGDIFDPLSAGCHRLICEGATPVTSARDVLIACGCEDALSMAPIAESDAAQQNLFNRDTSSSTETEPEDPIISYCATARTFDELCQRLQLDPDQLQEKLFMLQLSGTLEQDFTGRWCRKQ